MKKYRLVKETLKDDNDCGWSKTVIGYFRTKKAAMDFAHYSDNVNMWQNEYKKVMSIITMSIDLETIIVKDGVDNYDNCETLWIFD